MKKVLAILTLILSLALSIQGAAAQLEPGDGGETEDIEGLKSGYARTYAEGDFRSITIYAYTFESDDTAHDYLDQLRDDMDKELEAEGGDFDEVSIDDLEAVDEDGFEVTIFSEEEGIALKALAFADEKTVFVVMVIDEDVDTATTTATDISGFILEADTDDEDVTFVDDGTSSGGALDRMPADGDDVLGDFEVISDTDMME